MVETRSGRVFITVRVRERRKKLKKYEEIQNFNNKSVIKYLKVIEEQREEYFE